MLGGWCKGCQATELFINRAKAVLSSQHFGCVVEAISTHVSRAQVELDLALCKSSFQLAVNECAAEQHAFRFSLNRLKPFVNDS
eukprot:1066001-Amphidinium_carterae.3